jgi:hypothetical protein
MVGMLVAVGHRQDGLGVVQLAVDANEVVPRPLQAVKLEESVPAKPAKVRQGPFDRRRVGELRERRH